MISSGLSEAVAAEILDQQLGAGWQLSAPMGTMQTTRLAWRGDTAVVVKLIETPYAILQRLSDLGVTPEVLAFGEAHGQPYMIQQAVEGPHPDHAWFHANLDRWAELVSSYLNDAELMRLVGEQRPFWRLDVSAALALVERDLDNSSRHGPALRSKEFETAFRTWQSQATEITSLPMRTVHPDPHINNYVISEGRSFLLDWDHIDLSDPVRDVGWQIWGGLSSIDWPEFLRRVDIEPDDNTTAAVCWWSGFKMMGNALFNDTRGDLDGVEFHISAFLVAAQRRGWQERSSNSSRSDRLRDLQRRVSDEVTNFRASDRLTRDEVHDRDPHR